MLTSSTPSFRLIPRCHVSLYYTDEFKIQHVLKAADSICNQAVNNPTNILVEIHLHCCLLKTALYIEPLTTRPNIIWMILTWERWTSGAIGLFTVRWSYIFLWIHQSEIRIFIELKLLGYKSGQMALKQARSFKSVCNIRFIALDWSRCYVFIYSLIWLQTLITMICVKPPQGQLRKYGFFSDAIHWLTWAVDNWWYPVCQWCTSSQKIWSRSNDSLH